MAKSPRWTSLLDLERALDAEVDALLDCARRREGPTILVTNEVGSSVVPETLLGRAFRDMLGRVNQQAAAAASKAWLLVSGRAVVLPGDE